MDRKKIGLHRKLAHYQNYILCKIKYSCGGNKTICNGRIVDNGYSREEGFMTHTPVMNHLDFVEKEAKSLSKPFKPNSKNDRTIKSKVFKPPEFDRRLYEYYYYTEVTNHD